MNNQKSKKLKNNNNSVNNNHKMNNLKKIFKIKSNNPIKMNNHKQKKVKDIINIVMIEEITKKITIIIIMIEETIMIDHTEETNNIIKIEIEIINKNKFGKKKLIDRLLKIKKSNNKKRMITLLLEASIIYLYLI